MSTTVVSKHPKHLAKHNLDVPVAPTAVAHAKRKHAAKVPAILINSNAAGAIITPTINLPTAKITSAAAAKVVSSLSPQQFNDGLETATMQIITQVPPAALAAMVSAARAPVGSTSTIQFSLPVTNTHIVTGIAQLGVILAKLVDATNKGNLHLQSGFSKVLRLMNDLSNAFSRTENSALSSQQDLVDTQTNLAIKGNNTNYTNESSHTSLETAIGIGVTILMGGVGISMANKTANQSELSEDLSQSRAYWQKLQDDFGARNSISSKEITSFQESMPGSANEVTTAVNSLKEDAENITTNLQNMGPEISGSSYNNLYGEGFNRNNMAEIKSSANQTSQTLSENNLLDNALKGTRQANLNYTSALRESDTDASAKGFYNNFTKLGDQNGISEMSLDKMNGLPVADSAAVVTSGAKSYQDLNAFAGKLDRLNAAAKSGDLSYLNDNKPEANEAYFLKNFKGNSTTYTNELDKLVGEELPDGTTISKVDVENLYKRLSKSSSTFTQLSSSENVENLASLKGKSVSLKQLANNAEEVFDRTLSSTDTSLRTELSDNATSAKIQRDAQRQNGISMIYQQIIGTPGQVAQVAVQNQEALASMISANISANLNAQSTAANSSGQAAETTASTQANNISANNSALENVSGNSNSNALQATTAAEACLKDLATTA